VSDEAAPSDFVSELYLLVVETASLWEVPQGVTDFSSDGNHVVHGPWDPAECSRQLLAWLDAGLITLFNDPPDDVPRPRTAADWQRWNAGEFDRSLESSTVRQLLGQPERWTQESDDGCWRLVRTDAGMDPAAPWW
jgi:hypothetical protein